MTRSAKSTAHANYKLGDRVTVRAPATSANVGCGFDAFGIALNLWLHLTVEVTHEFQFLLQGDEPDPEIPTDSTNAVVLAFMFGIRHFHALPPPGLNFKFICKNDIPVARGLGSSAAAIVAGLGAAFALCQKSLTDQCVLKDLAMLACRREGHPDNVLPAIFGEMQIVVAKTTQDVRVCVEVDEGIGDYVTQRLPFPTTEIACLVYVPHGRLSTKQARQLLPDTLARADVTQNIGRGAIFVTALLLKEYSNLKFAVEDKIHQPHRAHLCPTFEILKDVVPVTDGLAVYLSGAGSSTVILCRVETVKQVEDDFKRLCGSAIVEGGKFVILRVSENGVQQSDDHLIANEEGVISGESLPH